MTNKPQPKLELAPEPESDEPVSIAKPSGFSIDKFKSKRAASIAGVETLLSALPVHSIADARDYVRLHPADEYWSGELCFVSVPVKGQRHDVLHLIEEDLAMLYLPSKRIERFRLALATKPYDVPFLCKVPSQNLDNTWNADNLRACDQAKNFWVQATSRKAEGIEGYKISFAHDEDAFPAPKWPTQSLPQLIEVTFAGRMIDSEKHPGLLRLLGARQTAS